MPAGNMNTKEGSDAQSFSCRFPPPCPLPSWDYYRFRSPRHGNLASRPRIIPARRTFSQEVVMAARDQYRDDSIDDPNAPIEPGPQPDPMLEPGRASVLQ